MVALQKLYTGKDMLRLVQTNDKAVERGLLVIYGLQTADERSNQDTKHSNGVGFNAYDAKFGSSLARQLNMKGCLTPNQMLSARKLLKRYVGQLAKVANGEIQNPLAK